MGMTSPEQELQWALQDLRIAEDNLNAAQRRLDDATDEWQDCWAAVREARAALDA